MREQTYLFIDGGHLQRHYAETMQKWSGTNGDLDLLLILGQQGASKCFYYDCVDDIRGADEDETTFNQRVTAQEERFNAIQRVYATHVRLGSMTGTRKNKRQKQVDILLAVEMMNHAARGNMSKATLLTGDQDFKPLVETLVDMGLHVNLLGDHRHTSRDLADAADSYLPLTLTDYWKWSSGTFQTVYPIPSKVVGNADLPRNQLLKVGTIDGKKAEVFYNGSQFVSRFVFKDSYMVSAFNDENRLIQFCEIEFGPVVLSPVKAP